MWIQHLNTSPTNSAIILPCQVPFLLWASVYSSVKWVNEMEPSLRQCPVLLFAPGCLIIGLWFFKWACWLVDGHVGSLCRATGLLEMVSVHVGGCVHGCTHSSGSIYADCGPLCEWGFMCSILLSLTTALLLPHGRWGTWGSQGHSYKSSVELPSHTRSLWPL